MSLGASLKSARAAARLAVEQLSTLADVHCELLEQFEAGAASLSAADLDRCARALGLRLEDLQPWTGTEAPLPMLLRESLGQDALLVPEVHVGLGEFQRTVRNVDSMEQVLGNNRVPLPRFKGSTRNEGGPRGEELADRVRKELNLEVEPIVSMRQIVESTFGIVVVWVTTEHLDASIDGASTSWPRPAMLVNLLEANRYPWRARTTLAHELCHLLFDHHSARSTLYSPARLAGGPPRPVPNTLAELETVARAFSACFLAPSGGVLRAVGTADPSSEEAIRTVGETYGVGREVAINRLSHVFRLPSQQRVAMMDRAPVHYTADFSGDDVVTVDGFRGDPLRTLVHRALAIGKIRPATARHILGFAPTDHLPFPELGELAAPTVSRVESLRRIAQATLRERYPGDRLDALEVREEGGGFRVFVSEGGIGCQEPRPRGYIDLSAAGVVSKIEIAPAIVRR